MAKLAPSILSCDFSRFQEELLSAYRGRGRNYSYRCNGWAFRP